MARTCTTLHARITSMQHGTDAHTVANISAQAGSLSVSRCRPTCHSQRRQEAGHCDAQQQVQPARVLLAVLGPRVVPRLAEVQQDDHLDDEEEARAKAGHPGCVQQGKGGGRSEAESKRPCRLCRGSGRWVGGWVLSAGAGDWAPWELGQCKRARAPPPATPKGAACCLLPAASSHQVLPAQPADSCRLMPPAGPLTVAIHH